jgi:hypothetical protein
MLERAHTRPTLRVNELARKKETSAAETAAKIEAYQFCKPLGFKPISSGKNEQPG